MDVSQNISIEPNAHVYKALPYQPTQLRAIDYVILTVSCLGIVGNLVSLVVWSSRTTYVPVIFLFKFLAVVDIQHLVSISSWRITVLFHPYLSDYTYLTVLYIFFYAELLGQALSLHTTLLIAVCRFLVVSRPLQVHNGTLLSRCQLIVACVVLFFVCLLITVPILVIPLLIINGLVDPNISKYVPLFVLFSDFIVITILMVVFNVLLLKKLNFSSALRSFSDTSQFRGKYERGRRLTLVVVLMSAFTVMAYLITGTCLAVAFVYFDNTLEISTKANCIVFEILVPVYEFFEALNSSINIIFYCAFFRNFRKVFPTDRKSIDAPESTL